MTNYNFCFTHLDCHIFAQQKNVEELYEMIGEGEAYDYGDESDPRGLSIGKGKGTFHNAAIAMNLSRSETIATVPATEKMEFLKDIGASETVDVLDAIEELGEEMTKMISFTLEGLHIFIFVFGNRFVIILIIIIYIFFRLNLSEKEADAKHIVDLEYALTIQVVLLLRLGGFLQNEEGSHTALEEARKAEEATERERLIGMFHEIFGTLVSGAYKIFWSFLQEIQDGVEIILNYMMIGLALLCFLLEL
ncbi:hypothetical protein ACJX0J_011756, partial [Zea mays]